MCQVKNIFEEDKDSKITEGGLDLIILMFAYHHVKYFAYSIYNTL